MVRAPLPLAPRCVQFPAGENPIIRLHDRPVPVPVPRTASPGPFDGTDERTRSRGACGVCVRARRVYAPRTTPRAGLFGVSPGPQRQEQKVVHDDGCMIYRRSAAPSPPPESPEARGSVRIVPSSSRPTETEAQPARPPRYMITP